MKKIIVLFIMVLIGFNSKSQDVFNKSFNELKFEFKTNYLNSGEVNQNVIYLQIKNEDGKFYYLFDKKKNSCYSYVFFPKSYLILNKFIKKYNDEYVYLGDNKWARKNPLIMVELVPLKNNVYCFIYIN